MQCNRHAACSDDSGLIRNKLKIMFFLLVLLILRRWDVITLPEKFKKKLFFMSLSRDHYLFSSGFPFFLCPFIYFFPPNNM